MGLSFVLLPVVLLSIALSVLSYAVIAKPFRILKLIFNIRQIYLTLPVKKHTHIPSAFPREIYFL